MSNLTTIAVENAEGVTTITLNRPERMNTISPAMLAELTRTLVAVNEDPAGKGWFVKLKLKDPAELEGLMSEGEYQNYVKTL